MSLAPTHLLILSFLTLSCKLTFNTGILYFAAFCELKLWTSCNLSHSARHYETATQGSVERGWIETNVGIWSHCRRTWWARIRREEHGWSDLLISMSFYQGSPILLGAFLDKSPNLESLEPCKVDNTDTDSVVMSTTKRGSSEDVPQQQTCACWVHSGQRQSEKCFTSLNWV